MGKVVFRSKMFRVEKKKFSHKGKNIVRDIIKGPDTVLILPILPDGRIVLERQYRYSAGKYLYELPAGHIDEGESPHHTAVRELEEETGYTARSVKQVFKAYPSPGSKTELMYFFLATELKKGKHHREAYEIMTVHEVTLSKALDMVMKNQIEDLKSIGALLYYARMTRK